MSVAYQNDIATLDPAIGYDWNNWPMEKMVFDALMDYDKDVKLIPQLGELEGETECLCHARSRASSAPRRSTPGQRRLPLTDIRRHLVDQTSGPSPGL